MFLWEDEVNFYPKTNCRLCLWKPCDSTVSHDRVIILHDPYGNRKKDTGEVNSIEDELEDTYFEE